MSGRAPSWKTITDRLSTRLAELEFGEPVTHVYDPLTYARRSWNRYLRLYGDGTRDFVMLGMNPGPWGMAQTGVPFGEIGHVTDWMGIREKVDRPEVEHPARPIVGFDCERSEVSGARLWGWARERFGPARAFFERFFVLNYCPLVFMEASGRNRTPDKLPAAERKPLFAACDEALLASLKRLKPRMVIGVGKFAEDRLRALVGDTGVDIARLPHPSPASPAANRGWARLADEALADMGIAVDES